MNVDSENEKANIKTGFEEVIVPYLRQKGVVDEDASLLPSRYSDEVRAFYQSRDKSVHQHSFPNILSQTFSKYYGVEVTEEEMSNLLYSFRKISRGYLKIYDGVSEALEALSRDFTLVIASHTQGAFTERELEELDIRKYFTSTIYSSDIGFKKTTDEFWQKCLEVAEKSPQDCAMVGDNLYEDMLMASKHGIHTVWLINPLTKDKFPADVEPEARLPIESWKELPNVIKTIWSA
jgi:HAD superfamily hydrolase (TIGR01549 family)